MFSYCLYVVCCLYVTFLLPIERATKAGPCHLFVFMVAIVVFWIFVSDAVEGVFHYICTGVVLPKYHWIWISACTVTIILLI